MPARLTAKEAKRLGLNLEPAPERSQRRAVEPYHTRCTKCGEHFTTMAAETRHIDSTEHRRFELVLTTKGTR